MTKFLPLMLLAMPAFADVRDMHTVCGKDERVVSGDKAIARLIEDAKAGAECTGTLISKSCMISAGHCKGHMGVAEFDVPQSKNSGKIVHAEAKNQYDVEQLVGSRYDYDAGVGNDWSVIKLKANLISGKHAGETRGFYKVNLSDTAIFNTGVVRITGYGTAKKELNFVQQTATGKIMGSSGKAITYKVDTTGGNSGSAIVLESTHEIIGVHTNGGCVNEDDATSNKGTLFSNSPDFVQAVKQCLALEK